MDVVICGLGFRGVTGRPLPKSGWLNRETVQRTRLRRMNKTVTTTITAAMHHMEMSLSNILDIYGLFCQQVVLNRDGKRTYNEQA